MSQSQELDTMSGGNSSRSSSPASEDIDMDSASTSGTVQRNVQTPQSLGSVHKAGSGNVNAPQAGSRTPKQVGRGSQQHANSSAGGKRRPAHGRQESSSHMREDAPSQYRGGMGGGLMDPAQGGAYDRLLDLTYPRDFGDPARRYDQATQTSQTSSTSINSQTNAH